MTYTQMTEAIEGYQKQLELMPEHGLEAEMIEVLGYEAWEVERALERLTRDQIIDRLVDAFGASVCDL